MGVQIYLATISAGVLATGGGVLFAASQEGNLMAFDSRTGKYLWRFQVGVPINSSPMSYATDGRQHIALSAGRVLYSFALPEDENGSQISALKGKQSRVRNESDF